MVEERYVLYTKRQAETVGRDIERLGISVNELETGPCRAMKNESVRAVEAIEQVSGADGADAANEAKRAVSDARIAAEEAVERLEMLLSEAKDIADSLVMLEGDVDGVLVRASDGA